MGKTRSSRHRFDKYRQIVRDRWRQLRQPGDKLRFGRQRSFFRLLAEFLRVLGRDRRLLALALAALTVSAALNLAPIYGSKLVFDSVLPEHPRPVPLLAWVEAALGIPTDPRSVLTLVAAGIVVLTLASLLFGIWGRWQATRLTKRLQVAVRKQVFEHAVRLPLHRVYALKSGGVASILREDAGGVAELVFSMIYNPWRAIIQLLGTLLILTIIDWRLLLGSLILLPVIYMTHQMWISRIRPLHRDIRASRQGIDGHATEVFGGMRVVRSFSRQRSETTRFTRDNSFMARQEVYAWWWMRGIDVAWSILIPLACAILLWYGGTQILADRQAVAAGLLPAGEAFSTGDLVMFLGYMVALLSPIETLANSATAFQDNLAGLDRVLDLMSESTEMPPRPGALVVQPDGVIGRITVHDVNFAYPQSHPFLGRPPHESQLMRPAGNGDGWKGVYSRSAPVLQHIALDVHPGEIVALVGPSGAGKTTLCNLIARFYDPTHGRILLDGVDLRDIDVESYRRLLGIVEQDTFLFDGTVAENIGYGRRGAAMDEIVRAAQLANAHDFITRLEHGYDTLIGERGVKLSGGQRQRLTIARAILADPRILILDEATSNLDTESERLIQASLHNLMVGRTCFVIAHRLSTIAHADRIVVLESGRIVEQGRHEELMRQSGRYRQMVELQTQPPVSPRVQLETPPPLEVGFDE